MTELVTMVADLNLKEVSMKDKLLWFYGNVNHLVVEFAVLTMVHQNPMRK